MDSPKMIFPDPLLPGACVGLIAPSSPVRAEEGIFCLRQLQKMGFTVRLGKTVRRNDNIHGYLAGTARERAADVNRMFADAQVKAVFCVRGGYGSAEILEYLDYSCIRKNPKIFVGYSDVTSIHSMLQKKSGLVSFHGPMVKPDLLCEEAYTIRSLYKACNMEVSMQFENPPGEPFRTMNSGRAAGRLFGGNLSVLAHLLGTPFAPDFPNMPGMPFAPASRKEPENCILFLEEVGESIPRAHMYLTQLRQAGVLEKVQGILLGDFSEWGEPEHGFGMEDFLGEWFKGLQIPVIGNVCSDHRTPMGTLPLGAVCHVISERGLSGEARISFFR